MRLLMRPDFTVPRFQLLNFPLLGFSQSGFVNLLAILIRPLPTHRFFFGSAL
jgi:hypothetical protein